MVEHIRKSLDEWKKELAPDIFEITRGHGTEPPFQNAYWDEKREGVYVCSNCRLPLFDSHHKFDSGTGWPSFWQPIKDENIATHEDRSMGMSRVSVECARCDAHLGHVFTDGPPPTGLRYCMNSAALIFVQ